MAFSGHYAAAQLHHLPLPHSLIGELAAYLAPTSTLVPPSYRPYLRLLNRLPTICGSHTDAVDVPLLPDEDLEDFTGVVHAFEDALNERGTIVQRLVSGTFRELRERAVYNMSFNIAFDEEDFGFFGRWFMTHLKVWPNVRTVDALGRPSATPHPELAGAVAKYGAFRARCRAHAHFFDMLRFSDNEFRTDYDEYGLF